MKREGERERSREREREVCVCVTRHVTDKSSRACCQAAKKRNFHLFPFLALFTEAVVVAVLLFDFVEFISTTPVQGLFVGSQQRER